MTANASRSLHRIRRRDLNGVLALVLVAAAAALIAPPTPARADTSTAPTPFRASFQGTFTFTFFTGEGGTHELFFHGRGLGTHLGAATVDGYSRLRPSATEPQCSKIVHDEVTLTTSDGSQLAVTNDAIDCMEVTPDGRILIHGRGTYAIVGGIARLASATGTGDVSTEAVVTGSVPSGVTGTFDPLTFDGTVRP